MSLRPFQNFLVRVQRGDTVFAEGEKGRTMYIVQSGLVGLYQQVNGAPQRLAVMEKGDFFGEMSILEGMPRTVSALAEADAELIEINNAVFDKMIRGNIEIAVRMLRKLSIRLREVEGRVAELQAGGARPLRRAAPMPESKPQASGEAGSGARLEAEAGGTSYALRVPETRIGRYDPVTQLKPDIDLTDLDLKRSVSRQHARILKGEHGYAISEEVGALNGTSVNGVRLTPGQPRPLADGDRVAFGDVLLVFHG